VAELTSLTSLNLLECSSLLTDTGLRAVAGLSTSAGASR
jgi:hypothetical protein